MIRCSPSYPRLSGYFPNGEEGRRKNGKAEGIKWDSGDIERERVEVRETLGLGRVLNERNAKGVEERGTNELRGGRLIMEEIIRLEEMEVRTEGWERVEKVLPGREGGSRWEVYRKRMEKEGNKKTKGGGSKKPRNPWEEMMRKDQGS